MDQQGDIVLLLAVMALFAFVLTRKKKNDYYFSIATGAINEP